MQLGDFLILKDENFNKGSGGGNQSIIKSLLLQKGIQNMLLRAQREKASFSPHSLYFLTENSE